MFIHNVARDSKIAVESAKVALGESIKVKILKQFSEVRGVRGSGSERDSSGIPYWHKPGRAL